MAWKTDIDGVVALRRVKGCTIDVTGVAENSYLREGTHRDISCAASRSSTRQAGRATTTIPVLLHPEQNAAEAGHALVELCPRWKERQRPVAGQHQPRPPG
ncbi:hypothetical protein [Streptomyces sp. NPDC088135]|uniref:hypothetical protein n=1 Tax=Streptomyces sp. NPDC088135 TaxID=3160993 RepID=UPI00342DE350